MIVGSGIDVIEISRIQRALERSGRFAERVFASREIASCSGSGRTAARYAVRFAAKEAVMKALGTGWSQGVRWVDIETLAGGAGSSALSLQFHGRVAELAAGLGVVEHHLAVSCTRSHAIAMVLLEGDER